MKLSLSKSNKSDYYWFLIIAVIFVTAIGIFSRIDILKTICGIVLILLLPGYCLSRILYSPTINIHTIPIIGSFSLFAAVIIALPCMIIYRKMVSVPLAFSFGFFCLGCQIIERFLKPKKYNLKIHKTSLFLIVILIVFTVFQVIILFIFWEHSESFNPDWAYEVGMITQLERRFPAINPEASWSLLKQPYGYWGVYAILVTITDLPTATIIKIVSIFLSVIFLLLINDICVEFFGCSKIGAWAAFFFSTTSEIRWLMRTVLNRRLMLTPISRGSILTSGGNLIYSWYNTPALIGCLAAVYFAFRFYQNREKNDWIIALFIAAVLPFFHPIYYGVTICGLFVFVIIKKAWKENLWIWLTFILSVLPFFFIYKFLLYRNLSPPIPINLVFSFSIILKKSIWYLSYCGLLIPLAIFALIRASDKTTYILPLALIPAFLAIFTENIAMNYHWYYDLHAVWLAIMAGIGIVELGKNRPRILQVSYLALIGITVAATSKPIRIVWKTIQNKRMPAVFQNVEYEVIGWIRQNTDEEDIFLTIPNSKSILMVEGLAKRLLVYGYTFHLRNTELPNALLLVQDEIQRIYCSPDAALVRNLLIKYNVAYIIVGPDESTFIDTSNCTPALYEITSSVYQHHEYKIYYTNKLLKSAQ